MAMVGDHNTPPHDSSRPNAVESHIGPNRPKIAQNRSMRPRNVHFTLTKMAIANQTQLTPLCFGYDRAALCAPSLVGELSVTLRDLPHTLFGGLRAQLHRYDPSYR